MKKTHIFSVLFLLFTIFFTACGPPRMQDLELNTDENLYAGEGEICKNQYVEVNCAEGLECMLISSTPHEIAKCYPAGTVLEEDLVNRPESINTNESQAIRS